MSSISKEEAALNEKLTNIARNLKLEIFDLDDGIYGYDSQDSRYGLEVIQTQVSIANGAGLGLVLTEIASNTDGRGLVLISEVSGNALQADPAEIQVGDVITSIRTTDRSVRERTTGLNYDGTVEAIGTVKEAAKDGILALELNRLVERAPIRVEIEDEAGEIQVVEALAGENLRRLLLRKGVKLYDDRTKRFDMPFATGDCAGEGLCGTCLVDVRKGKDNLNDPNDDPGEKLVIRGRPLSWRASCRTIIGADNKPGTVRMKLKPQSGFDDELDPGVRSVSAVSVGIRDET